jgi:hypothetical protein
MGTTLAHMEKDRSNFNISFYFSEVALGILSLTRRKESKYERRCGLNIYTLLAELLFFAIQMC